MTTQALRTQAASPNTGRIATALDIALSDYQRRYGDVRFDVVGMRVTDRGVEWVVTAR